MKATEFIIEDAVLALKKALMKQKSKIKSLSKKEQYDTIDSIMKAIAKDNNIKEPELHKLWVDKFKVIPDKWILEEAGKIGPHTGMEYELIVSGQKPATIQHEGEKDVPKLMKLVKQGKLVVTRSWQDWQRESYYLYFFAQPEYASNAIELKSIYDASNERHKKTQTINLGLTYDEHERIGELLGYSRADIDLFLANCKKLDAKKIVHESKSYPLYHSTTSECAINILEDGKIGKYNHKFISLTRNKHLWYNSETEEAGSGDVQFVVDTLKLSHNYKIEKYDFFHQDWVFDGLMDDDEVALRKRSESEERVRKPIPLKYVREVWIRYKSLDKDDMDEIYSICQRKYPWIVVKKVNY
jgi:hypothetical protein